MWIAKTYSICFTTFSLIFRQWLYVWLNYARFYFFSFQKGVKSLFTPMLWFFFSFLEQEGPKSNVSKILSFICRVIFIYLKTLSKWLHNFEMRKTTYAITFYYYCRCILFIVYNNSTLIFYIFIFIFIFLKRKVFPNEVVWTSLHAHQLIFMWIWGYASWYEVNQEKGQHPRLEHE